MDFLDHKQELDHVRISLKSNESSSTIYVEELPDYVSMAKPNVLSVYFYFRGNSRFDVLSLYEAILGMNGSSFDDIKAFLLKMISSAQERGECSHSLKDVDVFQVKPRHGYKIHVSGTDFFGFILWNSFFFVSKNRDFCLCNDAESAREIFLELQKNGNWLDGKSYLFLINTLINKGIHFYR